MKIAVVLATLGFCCFSNCTPARSQSPDSDVQSITEMRNGYFSKTRSATFAVSVAGSQGFKQCWYHMESAHNDIRTMDELLTSSATKKLTEKSIDVEVAVRAIGSELSTLESSSVSYLNPYRIIVKHKISTLESSLELLSENLLLLGTVQKDNAIQPLYFKDIKPASGEMTTKQAKGVIGKIQKLVPSATANGEECPAPTQLKVL